MIDSVKDFQDQMEEIMNFFVILDLLLESDLSVDVFDDENLVEFRFEEIDIEQQMKKNTNAQVLYNGDIISRTEARAACGREPLKESEAEDMYLQYQKEITLETQKVAAASSAAASSAKNSNAPTNQHGTNTGPQKSQQDSIKSVFQDRAALAVSALKKEVGAAGNDKLWIGTLIDMYMDHTENRYASSMAEAFRDGYLETSSEVSGLDSQESKNLFSSLESYVDKCLRGLRTELKGKVIRGIDQGKNIDEVFDSLQASAKRIDRTEFMRAKNAGIVAALKHSGEKEAALDLNDNCEICSKYNKTISLDSITSYNFV